MEVSIRNRNKDRNSVFLHFIILYHTFLILLIIISPVSTNPKSTAFAYANIIIKKFGLLPTLIIRVATTTCPVRERLKLFFVEWCINTCHISRVGILRILSKIIQIPDFKSSGHFYVIPFASYLLFRSMFFNIRRSNRIICVGMMVFYNVLSVRTVIFYHSKTECILSVAMSIFSCVLHNFIVVI